METLGADTLVHGNIGEGASLIVRLDGSAVVKLDDKMPLAVPAEALHLFDRETGKRVE